MIPNVYKTDAGYPAPICRLIKTATHMPVAAKETVVFVRPGAIFEAKLFAQRKHVEVIYVKDPFQVRMPGEPDTEKIVFLPFHPVGCRPDVAGAWHMRIVDGKKNFYPQAEILSPVVQVIDNPQFAPGVVGVVNAAKRRQELKLQGIVVAQELQQGLYVIPGGFQRQHAVVRRFAVRYCTGMLLFDTREGYFVVKMHK